MAKIGKSQVVASNQASASSEDGELHDLNLPTGGMSTDENTGEQACAAPVDGLVPVAPIKVTDRKDQAQNDCIPSDVSPSATALLDELFVAEKSLKSIRRKMWELTNDPAACEIDLCVLMQECELAVEDGQFVLEAIRDGKNILASTKVRVESRFLLLKEQEKKIKNLFCAATEQSQNIVKSNVVGTSANPSPGVSTCEKAPSVIASVSQPDELFLIPQSKTPSVLLRSYAAGNVSVSRSPVPSVVAPSLK